ncbi:hypothetical protein K2X85_20170 [bacterium]|nr:hypothetical protein [bacterium]
MEFAITLMVVSFLAAEASEGTSVKQPARRPYLLVTPAGPEDGGDFGPKTPGTKTSGLQEAFNAAKALRRDLFIEGGSWTEGKNTPVVYGLDETLNIPWMQDFRLDGGHYVINYNPPKGDAVVIDSQMSCSYRFGLIVSQSEGTVVRIRPASMGPDRFKVVTSTEFVFNAIVGGGGAWPGGEPYKNDIDPNREWKGIGLWLDASPGSIDANKITVIETVGCQVGLLLTGGVTRNTIEETNIHLCREHLVVGQADDTKASDNRIEAFVASQGIKGAVGARIFGTQNMITLSSQQMAPGSDVIFEKSAEGNHLIAHRLDAGITNRAERPTNRIDGSVVLPTATPALPASGEFVANRNPFSVSAMLLSPAGVTLVKQENIAGDVIETQGPLSAGTSLILEPGEKISLVYSTPPQWRWRPIR